MIQAAHAKEAKGWGARLWNATIQKAADAFGRFQETRDQATARWSVILSAAKDLGGGTCHHPDPSSLRSSG